MSATFIQQGHDMFNAEQMTLSSIYNQLVQQSTICAYMSSYKIYALAVILVLPLALILKKCCNTEEE